MKFEMKGYEIELKAKYIGTWAPRKMNREDTLSVLNQICIWAREAARTIYEFMESEGAFKSL